MAFVSAVLTILLVMDPLGNIPLFLTTLRGTADKRRPWIILREHLIALAILLAFAFLGRGLMAVLHLSSDALSVGGGVVLLLIAIRMIFPPQDRNLHEATLGEPLIVPLAVPLIAGPSVMATVLLFVSSNGALGMWIGALTVAWVFSLIILASSGWLQRYLGDRVLTALERLMGMVLAVMAVQMVLNGIKQFFGI